ncbi:tropomyosin-1, isoforms 33/34 [Chelmon rostratus]|uniref:tropomyosin-1, isoforms 33/34 n=1 Tax=Chelmon rostratus TaxID=109905 RepID=UPI001BE9697A|nr:tropomyosin-1, isoforms 33/34 [Chelmon rostratus]XP_041811295.1 tropomyosin-1, isoforms 33/34 [Chelmon rostratus]XP_041811296.1 tropomyosin-1, isoforms 33/34 [Chelmon rostratus]
MGCSTSSQTSAVDTTRPSAKPEESNGASTTGAANENGKVAEDSETIPDQTPAHGGDAKPADEPAVAATSADSTAAAPPAGEEPQPAAEAAAPADAPAAADGGGEAAADGGTEAAASSSEPAAAAPEQEKAEATATDSEPKTEEAPAPSE